MSESQEIQVYVFWKTAKIPCRIKIEWSQNGMDRQMAISRSSSSLGTEIWLLHF